MWLHRFFGYNTVSLRLFSWRFLLFRCFWKSWHIYGLLPNKRNRFFLFDQSMNNHRHIVVLEVIWYWFSSSFCTIIWRKCVRTVVIGICCGSSESRCVCCSTRHGLSGLKHRVREILSLFLHYRPFPGLVFFNRMNMFLLQLIFLFNRKFFQLCEVIKIFDVGDDVSIAHVRLGLILFLRSWKALSI